MATCVPAVCDSLTVTLDDDRDCGVTSVRSPAGSAPAPSRYVLAVPFGHDVDEDGVAGDDSLHRLFAGVVSFGWNDRRPDDTDRRLATALVETLTRTVSWYRSEQRAHAAEAQADNLREGLRTSRLIGMAVGILMSLHKITDDQAFALLTSASQRLNRKVRELAVEVVETGWLDPHLTATRRQAETAAAPMRPGLRGLPPL